MPQFAWIIVCLAMFGWAYYEVCRPRPRWWLVATLTIAALVVSFGTMPDTPPE